MLRFNLAPIFKARGIEKPYSFLVKCGLSPRSATNILNNDTRSLRLDHLEFLCQSLLCEPNDLLLWTPEAGQSNTENHPLSKLQQTDSDNNWQETYSSMSYQKLKEVTKAIMEKDKPDDA